MAARGDSGTEQLMYFPERFVIPAGLRSKLHVGAVTATVELLSESVNVRGRVSAYQESGTSTDLAITGINALTGISDTDSITVPATGGVLGTVYWSRVDSIIPDTTSSATVDVEAALFAGTITAGVELMTQSVAMAVPFQQRLHIVNEGSEEINVTISGVDSKGESMSEIVAAFPSEGNITRGGYGRVDSLISDTSTTGFICIAYHHQVVSEPILVNWRQTPAMVQVSFEKADPSESGSIIVDYNTIPSEYFEGNYSSSRTWVDSLQSSADVGRSLMGVESDKPDIPAAVRVISNGTNTSDPIEWIYYVIQGQNS